jgi:cytochrome c oxidase subunit II
MKPYIKKWGVYFAMSLLLLGLGARLVGAENVETGQEQVIKVSSRKFEFSPNVLKLKKGVPVILEFTSADVVMGFNAPDLKSRISIVPGVVARVRVVPETAGQFVFFCDVFCGAEHEDMTGMIIVEA